MKKVASEAALAEKAGWDEWKERRRHFRKTKVDRRVRERKEDSGPARG